MWRATGVKQIIIGHVIAWVGAVAFMALFIGDAFDWAVLPFVIVIPLAVAAVIRVMLLRRSQRETSARR
ncbi:hypothetical protein ACX80N_12410 [Arthrobacter sp. MDT2-16]